MDMVPIDLDGDDFSIPLHELPVTVVSERSPSQHILIGTGVLFLVLPPLGALQAVRAQTFQFLPGILGLIAFLLIGAGVLISALKKYVRRTVVTISLERASVEITEWMGESTRWEVPLKTCIGIGFRLHRHSSSKGGSTTTLSIELLHPDAKKTIRLKKLVVKGAVPKNLAKTFERDREAIASLLNLPEVQTVLS